MPGSGTAATPILYLCGETAHVEDAVADLEQRPAFEVLTATTASRAIEILSERPDIRCLLTGQTLPDADVFSFLDDIQSEHPELPVVLYPAESSEELAIEAISAGVDEYLAHEETADSFDVLVETICEAIDQSWTTVALRERLKELQAIQQVTRVLADGNVRPLPEILSAVIERIPESFQYPALAEVQLTVGETVVTTGRFDDTRDVLTTRTLTADGTDITLEVGYVETRPVADDGPFLNEEYSLCETVVTLLGGCVERRTYLESLTETEQLFRQLAENIREVAWISDSTQDEMLYVNRAYERVWGRSVGSLYEDPTSFLDAVHPEDRTRVEQAVAEQVTGQYDEQYRIVQPNGTVRWVHDRGVPMMDENGEVDRLVGLAEDITERKEREQQVAVLDRVLRHNLRNELNVVLSNAELIMRDAATAEINSRAETIASVSTRLMEAADKQRRVTRLLREPSPATPVNVEGLLQRVVRDVREEYPEATITVEIAAVDEAFLPPQIEIATTELLTNALEHTDSDSPTAVVSAETGGDHLVVRVSDDGPGIPATEREILGGEEEALMHGSGLGLWLVYWAVTYAGGTVSFEENEPRGSTVAMTFPQSEDDQHDGDERGSGTRSQRSF